MELHELTFRIRGAIFKVYNELGPGLLEIVYVAAVDYELNRMGLRTRTQVCLPVIYRDIRMELGFRLDIMVEEKVILEIKSIETLQNVHKKQLLTYLRLANKKLGILVNFNVSKLIDKESIIRIIN